MKKKSIVQPVVSQIAADFVYKKKELNMKKTYRVKKFYNYLEMYDVQADSEEQAKELVNTGHYDDKVDIHKDFDFYDVIELEN